MIKLLHDANIAPYTWNIKSDKIELTEAWYRVFGLDEKRYPAENREWRKRIHPDDWAEVLHAMNEHFAGKTKWFQAVYRYRSDLRGWVWIEDCGHVTKWDEQGKPEVMEGFDRDITEMVERKKSLDETNTLLHLASDIVGLRVWKANSKTKIIHLYESFDSSECRFNYKKLSFDEFLSKVHQKDQVLVKEVLGRIVEEEHLEIDFQFRIVDPLFHARWMEARARTLESGGFYGVIRDVDTEARRLMELDRLANRDLLTGLYNRNYCERKLTQLKDSGKGCLVAVCDVDGLKLLNDAFGHMMGDRMLRLFSMTLDEIFGDADFLARMGGDEFLIVDSNRTDEMMREGFRRLQRKVEAFDLPAQVSLSFGLSEYVAGSDPMLTYKVAEDRMYRQKHLENFEKRTRMVEKLLVKMQAKDESIRQHAKRMKSMIEDFMETLLIDENEKREMKLLAQFHDIGKLNVPAQILGKTSSLNHQERIEVKRHPEIGYRIARSLPELAGIAHEVLIHHERWDGKGYPLHLKGEEISYKVRILALFDYYDSVTHDRPYRPAIGKAEALRRIERSAGRRFDPELTPKFIEYMRGLQ